jgi:DNA-binding transcriptional LysR family regulator
MDIDTRLLRYFMAVAEEGNLTRAAERLYVSQPALTKQIRQLERLLGVQLFVRSRAGMTLTETGRTLVGRTSTLMGAWDEAVQATTAAASRAARILRVGFLGSAANEATTDIIASFRRCRPEWRVEMRQAPWSDPTAGLADAGVDAALVRLPFPGQDQFRVEVLLTEPRWVALPSGHPLVERGVIPISELRDEPFVAAPAETGAWRDFWLATDELGGQPPRVGAVPATAQPDDWLSAIANGDGVALAPESATRFYTRPGVVYRPVSGVSPSQVAVAWSPAADADPVVRDFVRSCLDHRGPIPDKAPGAKPGPM